MSSTKDEEVGKSDRLMQEFLDNRVEGKLLVKKKTRQLKLKQSLVQRNFQKYPIKQCTFEVSLGKHVYQPPKYSKAFTKLELANANCCSSCCLRPCVMDGKRVDFVESLKVDHEDPDFALKNAETEAVILFHRFCGNLWMRRMKVKAGPPAVVPECVKAALPRLLGQAIAELGDELCEPHEEVAYSDEFELTDTEDADAQAF